MTMPEIPKTVRDTVGWTDLRELDDHGENLTQYEIDFVESLTQQLLAGKTLTTAQRVKLDQVREERLS